MERKRLLIIAMLALMAGIATQAQTALESIVAEIDSLTTPRYESLVDSVLDNVHVRNDLVNQQQLPRIFFLPAVYNTYIVEVDTAIFKSDYSGQTAIKWLEDALALDQRQRDIMQQVVLAHPYAVKYNAEQLPEAPTKYDVIINPDDYTIDLVEHMEIKQVEKTVDADEITRKNWLHAFNGSLQFSEAYISPNWYQGGNNNLNALLNLNYNIKLNQKFHPKYLFETNINYKLGLYSTPDDSLRSYNVSQDLLQINSTFGVKATHRWYYTVNGQFKTQFLHSYKTNTRTLRSAFMSPAELNIGLGMTYNYANEAKTFTFDASISPLSYNLMICANDDMDPTAFGIDAGKHAKSQYGSSIEAKISWKVTNNISLATRLFGFTDYKRAYADLENTITFDINKYLSTQLYVYLRYDTNTPYVDPSWHKLQVKEILSLGFTYKYSTI